MKTILSTIFLSLLILHGSWALAADQGAYSPPDFDPGLTSSDSPAVSWHGYYEFEFLNAEGKRSTFDAHKITVWMGAKLGPRAYISSEVEYEHAPQLAGTSGSGNIKVDSAQLHLALTGPLAANFGVFYVPFGIEYLSYPGHLNKLITRPKAMKGGGVIPGTWSDVGAGVTIGLGPVGVLDLYAVNGDAYHGRVTLDSAEGGNESKTLGARVMIDKLLPGLNVGASIAEGKWDDASKLSSGRVGAHLRLDLDALTGAPLAPVIIGEWVAGLDENSSAIEGKDKKVGGYYVQASSRILPQFEVVARYGAYDNDGSVKNNARAEASVGAVLLAMERVRLKVEYQVNSETGDKIKNDLLAFQIAANW